MTYPHIDPNFSHKENLPDELQPDYIQMVIDVNNAVMEAHLNCENKNADCLECGNAECFMVFEAQAELQGMTLSELMESWRKQRELDEKAAEAQAKRFEYYQKKYDESMLTNPDKTSKKKSDDKQPNLFDYEKAA